MRNSLAAPSPKKLERGQALVLLALAFVGLAAFIGLTVDAGILFIQVGHLRRAVDAASLAAASQFRNGVPPADMEKSAQEFLELNNLPTANAELHICDYSSPGSVYDDPTLCPDGINPNPSPSERYRKFVRVDGQMPVDFVFMPVIGFGQIQIHAEAVSEAAALDLVLIIDTSESMAYDASCTDGDDDDGDGVIDDCAAGQYSWPGAPGPCTDPVCDTNYDLPDDYYREPDRCNPAAGAVFPSSPMCQPFENVKTAAKNFVNQMFFPYDHVALVSFAEGSTLDQILTDVKGNVTGAIDNLVVHNLPPCPAYSSLGDPRGCFTTNIKDGLVTANNEFAARAGQESVWVGVLLTDGAANQASDGSGGWWCPGSDGNPTWVAPFCRDGDPSSNRPGLYGYDAFDAAMDAGDLMACEPVSPAPSCPGTGGNGVVLFTIGLGQKVVAETAGDPHSGEKLLRYLAAVGDDGDPATNPCASTPLSTIPSPQSCGNYYFSPDATGLQPAFDDIADRIFTRITQ